MKVAIENETGKKQSNIICNRKAKIQQETDDEQNGSRIREEEKKIFDWSFFEMEIHDLNSSTSLLLPNRNINSINIDLIHKCTNLEIIDLSSNQIEELHPDTFNKCTNLIEIYLSSNHIKVLHKNTFKPCKKLEIVDFSSNQIKELHPEAFHACKELNFVFFLHNKLKELHSETFMECPKLKSIDFTSNQVKELPENTFKQCENLLHICFASNQIRVIHKETLQKSLRRIDFSSNQIEQLDPETFNKCTNLETIHFGSNQITELQEGIFSGCSNLGEIDFSYNQIRELDKAIFKQCELLKVIDFSSNKIKDLDLGIFAKSPKLNKIDFSKNQFKNFDIYALLNYNKTFDDPDFPVSISFSDNFIQRVPYFDFENFDPKPSIEIDLRNNFTENDIKTFFSYFFVAKDDFSKLISDSSENKNDFLKSYKKASKNFKSAFEKLDIKDYQTYWVRGNDTKFVKETFFRLFFNKRIYRTKENDIKTFHEHFARFENFDWSILDFLINHVEGLGANNLIVMNNLAKYVLKDNQKTLLNLDFRVRSGESVAVLCKVKDINLLKIFFDHDLKIQKADFQSRILEYETFYKSIDYTKCFSFVINDNNDEDEDGIEDDDNNDNYNKNEEIAIKLIEFLSHSIYDIKLNILSEKLNQDFNAHFLNKILVHFFNRKWWDAIEFLLDRIQKNKQDNKEKIQEEFEKNGKKDVAEPALYKPFIDIDLSSIEIESNNKKSANQVDPLSPQPIKTSDKKENHILKLIIDIKDKEQANSLLKHPTIKQLVHDKWIGTPLFLYYCNLLIFLLFITFYSINIEIYTREKKSSNLNVICKCICFLTLLYFIIYELLQLIYNLSDKERLLEYFSAFKNCIELLMFPLCVASLVCDLTSSDIHLKSSLYSISILGAYFIFASRLDKIPIIGKYIEVIGQILLKSMTILVFLLIALIGFILAFRNRSTFYGFENSESNSVDQMSYFNTNFEYNIFQLTAFSLGGLNTEQMGIEIINEKTLVNYIIYGCFIFFMPILFLNIFQSISIGEIQNLYEESEANEMRKKIEYIFVLEEIKKNPRLPFLDTIFRESDSFMKAVVTFIEDLIEKIVKNTRKSKKMKNDEANSHDTNLIKIINSKINQFTNKTASSEKQMEQNFKDIKVKIEKVEQNFEDIRSSVGVEKNVNTIINRINNIENKLSIKYENKDALFVPTNNTPTNIRNNESLEKRISALEKVTAMLSEEIKNKTTSSTLRDEPVSTKTVNNIDFKFENLDIKIKKINNL
jgi:Leucine-rich repeat (LRR) protein/uncharacterized membrane protein